LFFKSLAILVGIAKQLPMVILSLLIAVAICMLFPSGIAEAPRRFLSVGDLHGDFAHATQLFQSLGVMDNNGHWSGGSSVLVQTGDVVDRGNHAKEIYELLFRLQDEAPQSGGEVILLLGNHELMNMQGDFRYSTPEDTAAFGGSIRKRTEAFGPNGWPGSRLRERNQVLAVVGARHNLDVPVLYAHAGVLPSVAASVHDASGQSVEDAFNAAVRAHLVNKSQGEISNDNTLFFGDSGPLWTRRLALDTDEDVCSDLAATLSIFGAARMIVGHTAQGDGRVHHRCDGQLVLADTLISDAYTGESHPSAVEVLPSGDALALYPVRGTQEALPKVGDGKPAAQTRSGFLVQSEKRSFVARDAAHEI
jgi:hypothetical protein